MSAIPPSFSGTPAEMGAAMIQRLRIVVPSGILSYIYTGDTEPLTDSGPWLRNGQWWTFRADPAGVHRYLPVDISESETRWYIVQEAIPAAPSDTAGDPLVWIRIDSARNPLGIYFWNGTVWMPQNGIVFYGHTHDRPATPIDYQQFFDTDINALIWWERGAWRTVSGQPGDVKHVSFLTLSEALLNNPGWEVFGKEAPSYLGRIIVQATKDYGANPETTLTPSAEVAEHAAFEAIGGSETQLAIASGSGADYPATIALWTLVKT
jgi:hypothetical protein